MTLFFKYLLNILLLPVRVFIYWVVKTEVKVTVRSPFYDAQVELYIVWFNSKRRLIEDAVLKPVTINDNGFANNKDLHELSKISPKIILLYLYDPWKYAAGEGVSEPEEEDYA